MRVVKVCEKCKYFKRDDNFETTYLCAFFDDFSTIPEFYTNRSTEFDIGNCPYHLEHMVFHDADKNGENNGQ